MTTKPPNDGCGTACRREEGVIRNLYLPIGFGAALVFAAGVAAEAQVPTGIPNTRGNRALVGVVRAHHGTIRSRRSTVRLEAPSIRPAGTPRATTPDRNVTPITPPPTPPRRVTDPDDDWSRSRRRRSEANQPAFPAPPDPFGRRGPNNGVLHLGVTFPGSPRGGAGFPNVSGAAGVPDAVSPFASPRSSPARALHDPANPTSPLNPVNPFNPARRVSPTHTPAPAPGPVTNPVDADRFLAGNATDSWSTVNVLEWYSVDTVRRLSGNDRIVGSAFVPPASDVYTVTSSSPLAANWTPHRPDAAEAASLLSGALLGDPFDPDDLVVLPDANGDLNVFMNETVTREIETIPSTGDYRGPLRYTTGELMPNFLAKIRTRTGRVVIPNDPDRALEAPLIDPVDLAADAATGGITAIARTGYSAVVGRVTTRVGRLAEISAQGRIAAALRRADLQPLNAMNYPNPARANRIFANRGAGAAQETAVEDLTGLPFVERAFPSRTGTARFRKTDFFEETDDFGLIGQSKMKKSRWSRNEINQIVDTVREAEALAETTGKEWSAFLFVAEETVVPDELLDLYFQGKLNLFRM